MSGMSHTTLVPLWPSVHTSTVTVVQPTQNPPPTPPTSGVDVDVWSGNGSPPTPPPPGIDPDDLWIDLATGDVYRYTEE